MSFPNQSYRSYEAISHFFLLKCKLHIFHPQDPFVPVSLIDILRFSLDMSVIY